MKQHHDVDSNVRLLQSQGLKDPFSLPDLKKLVNNFSIFLYVFPKIDIKLLSSMMSKLFCFQEKIKIISSCLLSVPRLGAFHPEKKKKTKFEYF
jgi:hypothetical protein